MLGAGICYIFWQEHHITIPAVNYFHWRFIWSTLSEQDRRARAASHCRYHHRRESGSCFAVLFLLIMGDSYVFCVGTMAHTAAHRQIKFYNFNLKIAKKTIILRIPFFSFCFFVLSFSLCISDGRIATRSWRGVCSREVLDVLRILGITSAYDAAVVVPWLPRWLTDG
jgi:hypothetical protein